VIFAVAVRNNAFPIPFGFSFSTTDLCLFCRVHRSAPTMATDHVKIFTGRHFVRRVTASLFNKLSELLFYGKNILAYFLTHSVDVNVSVNL